MIGPSWSYDISTETPLVEPNDRIELFVRHFYENATLKKKIYASWPAGYFLSGAGQWNEVALLMRGGPACIVTPTFLPTTLPFLNPALKYALSLPSIL